MRRILACALALTAVALGGLDSCTASGGSGGASSVSTTSGGGATSCEGKMVKACDYVDGPVQVSACEAERHPNWGIFCKPGTCCGLCAGTVGEGEWGCVSIDLPCDCPQGFDCFCTLP